MHYNNTRSWTYTKAFQLKRDLVDPRIAIARHINWYRGKSAETANSVPEPDNYNRSIFADKPCECKFIKDQVFYFDKAKNAWFSVYYVPESQFEEFNLWIQEIKPSAVWHHTTTPKPRPQRPLLWNRGNVSERFLTDNERLHTLGYYENLKLKYFSDDPEYVDSLLGNARALLKDFVPEEQSDADYENY
jgi:hypothetical protein